MMSRCQQPYAARRAGRAGWPTQGGHVLGRPVHVLGRCVTGHRYRATSVCNALKGATTGGTTIGCPLINRVFGVSDGASLQQAITPPANAVSACSSAVASLQKCLTQGTAHLVGSVASDLHLPTYDADIVVSFPDFTVQQHQAAISTIASALKGAVGQQEGFSNVQQGEFSIQCSRNGLNLDILVGSADTVSPVLVTLDPSLTDKQRQALSASTAIATSAFLKQQPELFKTAVRLVKYWSQHVHRNDWDNQLRNRPKSYLLALLTLKAYQQYLATAAAATDAISTSSGHDQVAALDSIIVNFFKLAAQLSSNTLICWEVHYNKDVVQQVLARPDLARTLRPKGCEAHPLVLDPANPTNNVAAAVPGISRLVQLAAADLAAVEGDAIKKLEQRVQKLELEQQRAADLLSKQSAAYESYAKILGDPSLTYTYHTSFPLSAWLPDSKPTCLDGPTSFRNVPNLHLKVLSIPYKHEGYDGDMYLRMGLIIQLVKGQTPAMDKMFDMCLPFPLTVLRDVTVTMERAGEKHGPSKVELSNKIKGVLRGPTGVQVLFPMSMLAQVCLVGTVHSYNTSFLNYRSDVTNRLKQVASANYNLKLTLQFCIAS